VQTPQEVDHPSMIFPPVVDELIQYASAEASLHARSLTPDMDWRPPDCGHIAWVLAQYAQPSGRRATDPGNHRERH